MSRHLTSRLSSQLAASLLIALTCLPASATFINKIAEQNSSCKESSLQIEPKGFGNTIISFKVWMVRADNKKEVDFYPKCSGTAEQVHCPQLDGRGPAYVHFSEGGMKASDMESVKICVGARYYQFVTLDDQRNSAVAGSFSCTPYVRIGNNDQFTVPRVGAGPSAAITVSTKAFSDNRNCNSIKVDVYNVQF